MTNLRKMALPLWVCETVGGALVEGRKLHAFRSGGGLRVLGLDPFYGEHPCAAEAFRILADDIKAGGRKYEDVYGPIETNHWTGQSSADDDVDMYLLRGGTFDAKRVRGKIVFELRSFAQQEWPERVLARGCAGEMFEWTSARGVTFLISGCQFANGEMGTSMKTLQVPEGMDRLRDTHWYEVRRGSATGLNEAIRAAITATPEEETGR